MAHGESARLAGGGRARGAGVPASTPRRRRTGRRRARAGGPRTPATSPVGCSRRGRLGRGVLRGAAVVERTVRAPRICRAGDRGGRAPRARRLGRCLGPPARAAALGGGRDERVGPGGGGPGALAGRRLRVGPARLRLERCAVAPRRRRRRRAGAHWPHRGRVRADRLAVLAGAARGAACAEARPAGGPPGIGRVGGHVVGVVDPARRRHRRRRRPGRPGVHRTGRGVPR